MAGLSSRKRVAFHLTALLLPFALFGLGELVCRLCGYGGYPQAIERVASDGARQWYGTNRAGSDSFFDVRHAKGGGMRELHFADPKPANTVRILLLGESAVQGFPQPLPLTDGAFLQAMLRDLWGGTRRVEVLNLGATAVASYPVKCFLDEALDHDPDLVIVMTGNNEFYGAYGVVSLRGVARSPLGMRAVRWMRGLGLSQWLAARLSPDQSQHGTLMERLAAVKQVAPDSPLRRAAVTSLRANLAAMVRRCKAHEVPVILCTSPTNERDLHPLGEDVVPPLSADARRAFDEKLARGQGLLATDPAQTAELARQALTLWDAHAGAHFLLARALTALGQDDDALREYVKARDLDTMPWRATSSAQDAVRAAARDGAILCDMEAAFRAASPGGAIGFALVEDHVHMSLQGQALFARTVARVLTAMPPPLHVDAEQLGRLPDGESYAARQGHSVYSDYLAVTHLRTLFDIPFMKRGNAEAFERYDERCRALEATMSPADSAAIVRWHDPALHGATERPVEFVVGVYRQAAGDYAAAAECFRFARQAVPALSLWSLELTWRLLTCNRHLHAEPTAEDGLLCREAIVIGDLLRKHNGADNPRVLRYLGLAYNLAGDFVSSAACLEETIRTEHGKEGWEVVAALADSYQQLHRIDAARRLLELAVQDPDMSELARQTLRQIDAQAPPTAGDPRRP